MQSGGVVCCMKGRFKLDPGPDQVDHCSIVGVKGGGNLGISSGTDVVVAGFASGIRRSIVYRSRVPGLTAPKWKGCLCGLNHHIESILLCVGHASEFFSSHRIGDLYHADK